MADPVHQTTDTLEAIEADLKREKARSDKMLELLRKVERLWPDGEKGRVQSLIAQQEATDNLLNDCERRLEEKRRGRSG